MNRAVQYPFFPIISSFNLLDSTSRIIVDKLEQVLPLFPSEIKIDTTKNATKEVLKSTSKIIIVIPNKIKNSENKNLVQTANRFLSKEFFKKLRVRFKRI